MREKIISSKFLAPLGVLSIITFAYLLLGGCEAQKIKSILDNQWDILAFACYGFSLGIILCQLSAFKTKKKKCI